MNRAQVDALLPGLYLVHWKEGGTSLAAVGIRNDGRRWLAPTNWVAPSSPDKNPWPMVDRVAKISQFAKREKARPPA